MLPPQYRRRQSCDPSIHKSGDMFYWYLKLQGALEQNTCWLSAPATCHQCLWAYNFQMSCGGGQECQRKERKPPDKKTWLHLAPDLQTSHEFFLCVGSWPSIGYLPVSFNSRSDKEKGKQSGLSFCVLLTHLFPGMGQIFVLNIAKRFLSYKRGSWL